MSYLRGNIWQTLDRTTGCQLASSTFQRSDSEHDRAASKWFGPITFDIPQVRHGSFYPVALEKGLRSERTFTLALAEISVQGVSTRKLAAITEQLCGVEVFSSQVSRAAAQLDQVLEGWRTRPLGECRYLYLDVRYEKARIDGQVRDIAVLIALA